MKTSTDLVRVKNELLARIYNATKSAQFPSGVKSRIRAHKHNHTITFTFNLPNWERMIYLVRTFDNWELSTGEVVRVWSASANSITFEVPGE